MDFDHPYPLVQKQHLVALLNAYGSLVVPQDGGAPATCSCDLHFLLSPGLNVIQLFVLSLVAIQLSPSNVFKFVRGLPPTHKSSFLHIFIPFALHTSRICSHDLPGCPAPLL